MAGIIQRQNKGIVTAQRRYSGSNPLNNQDLARLLGIAQPPAEYAQDYGQSNVRVTVIWNQITGDESLSRLPDK